MGEEPNGNETIRPEQPMFRLARVLGIEDGGVEEGFIARIT